MFVYCKNHRTLIKVYMVTLFLLEYFHAELRDFLLAGSPLCFTVNRPPFLIMIEILPPSTCHVVAHFLHVDLYFQRFMVF